MWRVAVVVVALLSAGVRADAQVPAHGPVVLFMCPHGAAKSLMASAYFQKLAKERGLNVRVDLAGTEPDEQLSKGVVAQLQKNGYAIPIEKPRAATAADMQRADIVISMGCDLSKLPAPKGALRPGLCRTSAPTSTLPSSRSGIKSSSWWMTRGSPAGRKGRGSFSARRNSRSAP